MPRCWVARFADDEEVAAHATIAIVTCGDKDSEPSAKTQASINSLFESFFARWPDSQYLQRITFDPHDIGDLIRKMDELAGQVAKHAAEARGLERKIARAQLPIGLIATVFKRTYAEIVVKRAIGVIPSRHPDVAESTQSIAQVRNAFNHDTVIETSSLLVLSLLPEELSERLMAAFRSTYALDEVVADINAAQYSTLLSATAGTWAYDEDSQHGRLIEFSEDALQRAASELRAIADRAKRLPTRATLLPNNGKDHILDKTPWLAPVHTAAKAGITLWSDDAALRILARSLGAAAFSTHALVLALIEEGMLSKETLTTVEHIMLAHQIGDLALQARPFVEAAEEAEWRADSVAMALSRPAQWTDPSHGLRLLLAVLPSVKAHRPETLAMWVYLAIRGIGLAYDSPAVTQSAASGVLATLFTRFDFVPSTIAALVEAVRSALRATAPDPKKVEDPVIPALKMIYDTIAERHDHQTAAPYVTALAIGLNSEDQAKVRLMILGS